ncbi:MAG: DUF2400 domain-containing protein [Bacteroidales bacterium]|jgi:uncharacterized protein (TIGR02757 family)|nr:DUF2400 domain-containing protein [Bacteroidales bacterium]
MITRISADYFTALAKQYDDPQYFTCDPVVFPRHFFELHGSGKAELQDIEIAGVISAHLAWGRRAMIVRDCTRAFDEMGWSPYGYVMSGRYRNDDASLHRTVKWSEFARICSSLKDFYSENPSLETLAPDEMRVRIFSAKSDPRAANKKIHMFRRWMVRRDGIVDLGVWPNTDPKDLIIPLDVHVHEEAVSCGITERKSSDFTTACEITDYFKHIFPDDPCLGDFCLFGYGVTHPKTVEKRVVNC